MKKWIFFKVISVIVIEALVLNFIPISVSAELSNIQEENTNSSDEANSELANNQNTNESIEDSNVPADGT